MSEQLPDDQKAGNRKRPRPSDKDETTEGQVEEPPKKQSRRNSEASTCPPSQADAPQQLPYKETSDMDVIRRERRRNAYRILDEVLPSLIARLRDLDRRSKAAADERTCCNITDQQGLTGPCIAPKKRRLDKELKQLLDDVTDLLRHQAELQKAGEKADESKLKSAADRLQQLDSQAAHLIELHREIHQANDDAEEESQKRCLEQIRLIINHPIFDLDEEPLQQQGDAPNDPQAPLHDTAELIDLVADEMRKVLQCFCSLKQWLCLYEPRPQIETNHEHNVRAKGLDIIGRVVHFIEISLATCLDYVVARSNLELKAIEEPLSFDRMRALDSFENVTAIIWRTFAVDLADRCERLIDFVKKHIRVLEQSKPKESAANHLYC